MSHEKGAAMKTRRQALALAGALTLTVITAVAAVAGMSRGAAPKPASPVVATQVAQPSVRYERGDD
jgi:hypothetical protein